MRNIYIYITVLLSGFALYSCNMGRVVPRALPGLADGSCETYESIANQINTTIDVQPAIYPQESLDDQHVIFNDTGTYLYIFYVADTKSRKSFQVVAEYDSREFPYNNLYLAVGSILQTAYKTNSDGYPIRVSGPFDGKLVVFPMRGVSTIESNHILRFKANYEILESSDYGNPNAKAIQSGTFSFTCNYIRMDENGKPIAYRKLRKTHTK